MPEQPAAGALAGQVAIVTGAARGIGLAIATRLAAGGARVVIGDLHGTKEAAATLLEQGHAALGLDVDVSDADSVEEMMSQAAGHFGGLDILVNNAGIFSSLSPTPFTELTSDDWHRILDVNVVGVFHCCRAAVGRLAAGGGGRVINIASAAPFKGLPYFLHYLASKGAVLAMTRGLARELADRGILVNAVAPGFTVSDGVAGNTTLLDAMADTAIATRLLHRPQEPADIAGLVAFLAGPDSSFITGQTFIVDGGSVLH
jgi:NAD(P)-dependent dehydrogenase (short-subunit alcohol dehydrogenase family)